MKFTEIEHKFLVSEDFDLAGFGAALAARQPRRMSEIAVADTYFMTRAAPGHVFRHRFDRERQELTVKDRAGDAQVRREVNLRLDLGAGDQGAAVAEFLRPFGLLWQGALHKDLRVWYFADCEVVHYVARGPDRSVRCVEFEAVDQPDLDTALGVLARYEAATGFSAADRVKDSLFDLLLRRDMERATGRA